MSEPTEIALVDLSAIAHPTFRMSGTEPDPDWTANTVVARVRALTANHPQAAICCDSPKSFRKELDPTYKANRPEREAVLHHQIALAVDRLKADGFPVWRVDGYEADDLIATAVTVALGLADVSVLILSADKDLMQLVGPRVRQMSTNNGAVLDADGVLQKFGVKPSQMRDYLALVGDASDNIKGAQGIGPVKATELLQAHGDLNGIYAALDEYPTRFRPAVATSLRDFRPRMLQVCALIDLQCDVPIPFADLDAPRVPTDIAPLEESVPEQPVLPVIDIDTVQFPPQPTEPTITITTTTHQPAVPMVLPPTPSPLAPARQADVLAPAPAEFERQLEPRSINEAIALSNAMHNSRLFSGYGTPQAVLSTVLAGRELGLQAMASLRGIHIVEGRHMLSADLLRALVLRSGLAEYFRCTERTADKATFLTKRKSDPEAVSLSYTIEEAKQAGVVKPGSGWAKNPADMLVARSSAKLARLVYPEIVHGLYSEAEFD